MLSQTILHIGLDKTGSTAIQLACLNNKQFLLAKSILYPLTDVAHGQLGSCFYDNPLEYIHNIELARTDRKQIAREDEYYLQGLTAEIAQSGAQTMILSSEAFGYMHAASVIRLKEFLATISQRVLVILYCRPPLSYAVSALSQRARTGMPLWSEPPVQEIRKVCLAYEAAFGRENIVVRPFSREYLPDGDVRLDFFSFAGLAADDVKHSMRLGAERDNTTLTAEAVRVAEALRRIHADRPLANIEFSLKYEPLLRTIRGGPIRLTRQQAAEVKSVARDHVEYAKRVYQVALVEKENIEDEVLPEFCPEALDSIAQSLRRLVELDQSPSHVAQDITSSDLIVSQARLAGGPDVEYGQVIAFEMDILVTKSLPNLELGIHIFDAEHRWAFGTNTRLLGRQFSDVVAGSYRVIHNVVANLPIGSYTAGFAFTERLPVGEKQLAWFNALCDFSVTRTEDQIFAGYAYLPAEITLLPTLLATGDSVIRNIDGTVTAMDVPSLLAPNQRFSITVEIFNQSSQDWKGDPFRPINLAYRWFDANSSHALIEGARIPIPESGISAGAHLRTEIQAQAPSSLGPYLLLITLVQEHVGWFNDMGTGFLPALLDIVVETPRQPAVSEDTNATVMSRSEISSGMHVAISHTDAASRVSRSVVSKPKKTRQKRKKH